MIRQLALDESPEPTKGGPWLFVNSRDGERLFDRQLTSYKEVIEAMEEYPMALVTARGLSHKQHLMVASHFGYRCHCRECRRGRGE